jgi:hypothetical protein
MGINFFRQGKEAMQTVAKKEKAKFDVSRTDHSRDGELIWASSYHNHYLIHVSDNLSSNYYPSKKASVYWIDPAPSPIPDDKPAKTRMLR